MLDIIQRHYIHLHIVKCLPLLSVMVTVVVANAPTMIMSRSVPVILTSRSSFPSNMLSSIALNDTQTFPDVGIAPAGIVILVAPKKKSLESVNVQLLTSNSVGSQSHEILGISKPASAFSTGVRLTVSGLARSIGDPVVAVNNTHIETTDPSSTLTEGDTT